VEGIKQIVQTYLSAFPDLAYTVEEQVAEGDMVVTRWRARGTHQGEFMGVAPSGNTIEVSGMSMYRIAGGEIAEDWVNWDALEMMHQVGAVPQSGPIQGI
jgi:predicted ester cyclase